MEGPDAPMTEPARPADEATPQWWPPELDSDYELVGEQGAAAWRWCSARATAAWAATSR